MAVPVGQSGVKVTRLGFGSAPIGGLYAEVSENAAREAMDTVWETGVRFFDTAPLYGMGNSEARVGRALRTRPRTEFTVSTKVGRLLHAADPPHSTRSEDAGATWKGVPALSPVFDFSYDATLRSLEESLERLGLDRVDIVHIHDPDDYFEAALEGAYRALLRLRDERVVGAIGVGMNQWQALERFARAGDFDCFLLAGRYTLLDQSALDQFLPLCLERNIAVFAGGVFNSGILAAPHAANATYDYVPAARNVLARVQKLDRVCRSHGVPLKAAALQFPAAHPSIASVVVGSRSRNEAAENAAILSIQIPNELWADLKASGLLHPEAPTPEGQSHARALSR